jgi:hypothetical protein
MLIFNFVYPRGYAYPRLNTTALDDHFFHHLPRSRDPVLIAYAIQEHLTSS